MILYKQKDLPVKSGSTFQYFIFAQVKNVVFEPNGLNVAVTKNMVK